jgi:hypothetical protein
VNPYNILNSSVVTSCMMLCYLLVESLLMPDISIMTPVLIFKDTRVEMENKETEGIHMLIHISVLMLYYK